MKFDLPTGLQFSPQNEGYDDTLDSDANPVNGQTAAFNLVSAQNDTTRDAGLTDGVSLSIGDVTITEGDSGTKQATFTVTLSQARNQVVTVGSLTSNGTGVAGLDYTGVIGGVVMFPAQETTQTFTIDILGDTLDETAETFFVNLSNPVNAAISDGVGQGNITDNDLPPSLSIDDVTVTEGDSGTTAMVFTVSLSQVSGKTVNVQFSTRRTAQPSQAKITSL